MQTNDGYRFESSLDKAEFDAFVQAAHGNLLQTSQWAKLKDNWTHLFTGLYSPEHELTAAALVLKKELPMGYSFYYIPRGPVAASLEDKIRLLNALKQYAKEQDKAIFIKFDPDILSRQWFYGTDAPQEQNEEVVARIVQATGAQHFGYTMHIADTVQPRTTMGVALDEGFETRYHRNIHRQIKRAAPLCPRIEVYTKDNLTEAALDAFCDLMHKTEDAKGVSLRGKDYFSRMMELDGATLYLEQLHLDQARAQVKAEIEAVQAKKETKKTKAELARLEKVQKSLDAFSDQTPYVSGLLVINHGDYSDYLYMGTDRTYIKEGVAPFLYDYAYHDSQSRGIVYADLSGVEGTLDDGLTAHKKGYGSTIKEYIGEFDIPVRPALYKMFMVLWKKRQQSHQN